MDKPFLSANEDDKRLINALQLSPSSKLCYFKNVLESLNFKSTHCTVVCGCH